MFKRFLLITAKTLLPVVIIAAAAFGAKKMMDTRQKPQRRKQPKMMEMVDVIIAERGVEPVVIETMGTVLPSRTVTLQPEVTGRIVELSADFVPGGRFKKGEIVARVDPRDYEIAVEQRKADVERAKSELELEEGRQTVAKREWDLFDKDIETTDAGRNLALRKPQLANAKASLAAAQSGLKQAQLGLERTTIRSPFDAVVREQSVNIGQLVNPQTKLGTLVGTQRYWVQATIPVDRLKWITVPADGENGGSPARIVLSANSDAQIQREGSIIRLLSDLDPIGRMARALIAVDDPLGLKGDNAALLLGAYVRVEIEGAVLDDVYVLPRKAIREGDMVWVMDRANKLQVRTVEIVWRREETVAIGKGLDEGERVVVSHITTPVPGMELKLIGEDLEKDRPLESIAQIGPVEAMGESE